MRRSISRSSDNVRKRRGSKISNDEKSAELKPETPKEQQEGEKLIESEEAAVGDVAFGVYIRYFKSVGTPFVILILFFAMCSEASSALANCKSSSLSSF